MIKYRRKYTNSILHQTTARENALKGVRKWHRMSHTERLRREDKPSYSWSFTHENGRTKDIVHKPNKKALRKIKPYNKRIPKRKLKWKRTH